FAFHIALRVRQLHLREQVLQLLEMIGEGTAAVDVGLARAEQVEVRTVEDEDAHGGAGAMVCREDRPLHRAIHTGWWAAGSTRRRGGRHVSRPSYHGLGKRPCRPAHPPEGGTLAEYPHGGVVPERPGQIAPVRRGTCAPVA